LEWAIECGFAACGIRGVLIIILSIALEDFVNASRVIESVPRIEINSRDVRE